MKEQDLGITATHAWNDYLGSSKSLAEEAASFQEQMKQRGLMYADRPICTVYRPRFGDGRRLQHLANSERVRAGS